MAFDSKNKSREEKEFEERVIHIGRVSKTVKGGKNMRFAALVVIGDKKGRVGKGIGKSTEVPDAIRKGIEEAKKNIVTVSTVNGTIPHETIGEFAAAKIVMKPAASGTGVIAGGPYVQYVNSQASRTSVQSPSVPTTLTTWLMQLSKVLRDLSPSRKLQDFAASLSTRSSKEDFYKWVI